MVFLDSFNLVIAADLDIGRDFVEVTFFSVLPYLLPVCLGGTIEGAFTDLYGTFEAGILFEAVGGGPVVFGYHVERGARVLLLEGSESVAELEVDVGLDVDRTGG